MSAWTPTDKQQAEIDRRVCLLIEAMPDGWRLSPAPLEVIQQAGDSIELHVACALEDLYRLKNWATRAIQTLEAIALRHNLGTDLGGDQ